MQAAGDARGLTPSETDDLNRWTTFIIICAIVGIIALTLFPFQLYPIDTAWRRAGPFFTWFDQKSTSWITDVLNVILFLPFGFGIASLTRKKSCGNALGLAVALISSFLFTFLIELAQSYMPHRNSSWIDMTANTLGGGLGFVLFRAFGFAVLGTATKTADAVLSLITPSVARALYVGYLVAILVGSVPLQRMSQFENWDSSYRITLGNSPEGTYPWRGQISRLDISRRALSADEISKAFTDGLKAVAGSELVSSYAFSPDEKGPVRDSEGVSPEFLSVGGTPRSVDDGQSAALAFPWLTTAQPASQLVERFRNASQLSLELMLSEQNKSKSEPAYVLCFGRDVYEVNLALSQVGSDLQFRLRTPLTGLRGEEPRFVVPSVFLSARPTTLLFVYDGTDLKFFQDGRKSSYHMHLGPGAALVKHFIWIRFSDLRGYRVLFWIVAFAPLGLFLGISIVGPKASASLTITQVAGVLLPPLLLAGVLSLAALVPFQWIDMIGGTCVLAGSFWSFRIPIRTLRN